MTEKKPEITKINSQLDWVVSYPKSGNTWVRMLLRSYCDGKILTNYDDGAIYFFQTACPYPVTHLEPWQEIQVRGAALFALACAANNNRAIVKSHHSFGEYGGLPLFAPCFVRKAIYVVRDPRDVACSLSHHFNIDRAAAVTYLATPGRLTDDHKMTHILSTWSGHVGSWTRQDKVPTIYVRYEDLHTDTAGELRQILEFLEWGEIDEEKIARAVDDNRFEVLQELERQEGFQEATNHGPFFRRGQVRAYQDELTSDLVAQIEDVHSETMGLYDYELTEVGALG